MNDLSPNRRGFLRTAVAASAAGLTCAPAMDEAVAAQAAKANPLKITQVQTFLVEHDLPHAIGPSTAYYRKRTTLLIKISTDAGLIGWGETAPLGGVQHLIETDLAPQLVGQNPLEHRKLWRSIWGPNFGNGLAVGGLDIALQDLRGKALNLPVADLYGGRLRDRVPAYASCMNYQEGVDPEKKNPPEAKALVERGFRALKMRIGGLPVPRDLAAAAAVRDAVGPDILLMADGNGAYTLGTALEVGNELEQLDFHFYEEPLPQPNYAGYEVLTRELTIPIAAGEGLDSRSTARELIARRAMQIIQPDISLCGGFAECLFVAEMARVWGMQCIPHCWGGALVIAATVQLVSLLPDTTWSRTTETPFVELDVYPNIFREELITKPFAVRDGLIDVPTAPGLGVEVNEEIVRKYLKKA